MWKGLAAIAALEMVLLATVIAGVLSSEPDSSFPPQRSRPITTPALPLRPAAVKVTVKAPPARGGASIPRFTTNPDTGRV